MAKRKTAIQVSNTSLTAVNPQTIILKAIEKDLDIDKMERLLAMRKDLEEEASRKLYFMNLAKFQKECPIIKKKAKVLEKNSKDVRYCYARIEDIIEQVKDALEKYGFSYSFKTDHENGLLTTECVSYHEAGHKESTKFKVPIDMSAYMSAPQKVASASTFSKRYAFCNAFGIATESEDNDANIPDDKPGKEKAQQKKDNNKLPEKNEKLYKSCISVIHHEYKGYKLFAKPQMIEQTKALNAVKCNLEKLTNLHKALYDFADNVKSKIDKQNGTEPDLFNKEENIVNIADYQEVKPDNSKQIEDITKQTIELLNSKNKEGKRVFSSEEMIKNKRAIDGYIKIGKISEALNALDVIKCVKAQRVGE